MFMAFALVIVSLHKVCVFSFAVIVLDVARTETLGFGIVMRSHHAGTRVLAPHCIVAYRLRNHS